MNLLFPRPQFVDSNGLPLASGTLETYAAGTTTPKATYPTKADFLAQTNPNNTTLTLNSSGTPTVDLWCYGTYKFLLKDANSNLIYSVDNINDVDAIRDSAGNIILKPVGVSNSVNYLSISNAATGNPVMLQPIGSDSNIGLNITASTINLNGNTTITGTATINQLNLTNNVLSIPASNSSASAIKLFENKSNGSNYIQIQAPSAITSNSNLRLPSDLSVNGYLYNTGGVTSITSLQSIKQVVSSFTSSQTTTTTTLPFDSTIPQNTEGGQMLSVSITPNTIGNNLLIFFNGLVTHSIANTILTVGLFQDTTANALTASAGILHAASLPLNLNFWHLMTASAAISTTFKIRIGGSVAGTTTLNPATFGGVVNTGIIIVELGV